MNGFTCPNCRGVRLHVTHILRVAPGLIVRYRQCTACQTRIKSHESPVVFRPRKRKSATRITA